MARYLVKNAHLQWISFERFYDLKYGPPLERLSLFIISLFGPLFITIIRGPARNSAQSMKVSSDF